MQISNVLFLAALPSATLGFLACGDQPSSGTTSNTVSTDRESSLSNLSTNTLSSLELPSKRINCEVAQEIDSRWDQIVEELRPCFFGSRKTPPGQLNSSMSTCSLGNRSLELSPPLDLENSVVFGDNFTRQQTIVSQINGNECFTLTRKANDSDISGSFVRITRGAEVLFETTRDQTTYSVQMGPQKYYLPLDTKSLADFKKCHSNISGRWGADHIFYGPESKFISFDFHISSNDGLRLNSACKK